MNNTQRVELITQRIEQALSPTFLQVIDDSADHIGHAGAASGAGHFTVVVESQAFKNLSLVQQHRLIYQAIGNDLMGGEIHALRIDARVP